ncbi:MAG: hypothetical protein M1334_00305 [Patescibacteria group bacterium]|nr:hypothetical protein [Patescibacteria group bacterium]
MKKLLFITTFIFVFGFVFPVSSFAQGMMGFSSVPADNAAIQSQQQEEQEGKNFLSELTNKIITCSQLKDADFEKIGEYFMGQAIGDTSRHIAMNEMMKSMMGEQGEEQMHIIWGKRGSGCDTSSQGTGYIPMMQIMMGGGSNSMMGNWGQNPMWWGGLGSWLISLLWLVWLIVGILVAVWLWRQIVKK